LDNVILSPWFCFEITIENKPKLHTNLLDVPATKELHNHLQSTSPANFVESLRHEFACGRVGFGEFAHGYILTTN